VSPHRSHGPFCRRTTRRWIACAAVALLGVAPRAARAELAVRTEPSPIVLGGGASARLILRGELPADPVRADVNVGTVERVDREGAALVIHYALPAGRHPRRLCLLLWQDVPNGRAHAIRVPLLGRSVIPVRTRRNSTVVVRVGDRSFGPASSGPRGLVSVPVLVAPGETSASVEVTDKAGLTSSRTVRIKQPPYDQLAAAAIPSRTAAARVAVRVVVAAADHEISGIDARVGDDALGVRALPDAQWEALWSPEQRPAVGAHAVALRAEGPQAAERTLSVEVLDARAAAAAAPVPRRAPSKTAAPRRAAAAPRRWHAVVGAGAGLMSNLGDLLAPRFVAEVGLDRTLSWGVLGARVQVGMSWASQEIGAGAAADHASASVLLVPFSLGLAYRLPLRYVEPCLSAAFVAQLVRSRTAGAAIAERVLHHFAPGFSVAAGAGYRLGPGHVYLQAGYLHGRIDAAELKLRAGGLTVDAGYRLSL
jgi:hypothetical protein